MGLWVRIAPKKYDVCFFLDIYSRNTIVMKIFLMQGWNAVARRMAAALALVALFLSVPCGVAMAQRAEATQDGWRERTAGSKDFLYWVRGVGYRLNGADLRAEVVATDTDLEGEVTLPDALLVTRDAQGNLFNDDRYSYKVTSIGAQAFKGRDRVTKVILGQYVATIESEAFAGCALLAEVAKLEGSGTIVAGTDSFKGSKVAAAGITTVSGGIVLYSVPTGHGSVVAMLGGRKLASGAKAEKGELVLVATADDNYEVAGGYRRNGAYTGGEKTAVGVWIDGNLAESSAVQVSKGRKSVQVKIALDGTKGTKIEVAFMPRMVVFDCGELDCPTRVFTEKKSTSKQLGYRKGGKLVAALAPLQNASSSKNGLSRNIDTVEWGARVYYKAFPGAEGSDATYKNSQNNVVWAVDQWRVGGQDLDVTGDTYARQYYGDAVQVRFKRMKFAVRYGVYGKSSGKDNFGTSELKTDEEAWLAAKSTGEIKVSANTTSEVGVLANGAWVRNKQVTLLEDTYVERFFMTNYGPTLVMVSEGRGSIKVMQDQKQIEQGGALTAGKEATITAQAEEGWRLSSLTVRGAQVPIADGKSVSVGWSVPRDASFRIFAAFVPERKQVLTITPEGVLSITVMRDGRELKNGDAVQRGDRLIITAKSAGTGDYTNRLVALTVNGAPFYPGDVYVVGDGDVHVSAVAPFNSGSNEGKTSVFTYAVFGPGALKVTAKRYYFNRKDVLWYDAFGRLLETQIGSQTQGSQYGNEKQLVSGSILEAWGADNTTMQEGGWFNNRHWWHRLVSSISNDLISVVANANPGARLVRLTANGQELVGNNPVFSDYEPGEDVYVEAVFASDSKYVWMQRIHSSNDGSATGLAAARMGYVEVYRNGVLLHPGEEIREGDQLTIKAKPSTSKVGVELELLTVNGAPWESGRTYTVQPSEHVYIDAWFGDKDIHRILLSQKGEGAVALWTHNQGGKFEQVSFPSIIQEGKFYGVTATPMPGWKLRKLMWGSSEIDGTHGGDLRPGKKDIVVFAHFTEGGDNDHYLYLPKQQGGWAVVTRQSDGRELGNGEKVKAGEKLTIRLQPHDGYEAGLILVNGDPIAGDEYTVPKGRDVTVTASFRKKDDVVILLNIVGEGMLTAKQGGRDLRNDDNVIGKMEKGTPKAYADVDIKVFRKEGYRLALLSVDGEDVTEKVKSDDSYTITKEKVRDNRRGVVVVKAVFVEAEKFVFKLDVKQHEGGVVQVWKADGSVQYHSGDVVPAGEELTIKPVSSVGWQVGKITVNGDDWNGKYLTEKYTPTGKEDVRIYVNFARIRYQLKIVTIPEDGSGGSLGVEVDLFGNGKYEGIGNEGTVYLKSRLRVTPTPNGNQGYELKSLSAEGAQQVEKNEYEVQGDVRLVGVFGKTGAPVLVVKVLPNGEAGEVLVTDVSGNEVKPGAELQRGHHLTVTARAKRGYKLVLLKYNGTQINPPHTLTVGDSVEIEAIFEEDGGGVPGGSQFGLLTDIYGGGEGTVVVTRRDERVYEGLKAITAGDILKVEATAKPGSRLVGLTINGVEVGNPYEGYEVQGNVMVRANFAVDGMYSLQVNQEGPGIVKVYRNGRVLWKGEPVRKGEKLWIEVEPEWDAHTSSLLVDGLPFLRGRSITIQDHDVRIDAVFAYDRHPGVLSIRSSAGGRIRVQRNGEELAHGAELQAGDALAIEVKEEEGYQLVWLEVNGWSRASGDVYPVKASGKNGAESVAVVARFAKKRERGVKMLHLVQGAGGWLAAKDGSGKVLLDGEILHEGQKVIVEAAPHPGNTFKKVKISGTANDGKADPKEYTGSEAIKPYEVTSKDEVVEVRAEFEQKEYTLHTELLGGGTGSLAVLRRGEVLPVSSKVYYGDELKVKVEVDPGSECKGVWINHAEIAGVSPYWYQVGESNVLIQAQINEQTTKQIIFQYALNLLGGAKGTLTATKGSGTDPLESGEKLNIGDKLKIAAKAEAYSRLQSLTINGESVTPIHDEGVETVWVVPNKVKDNRVYVVAEFLPAEMYRLEVVSKGPGEVQVRSMDGTRRYEPGDLVKKGDVLRVEVTPNQGAVCKLLVLNGETQALQGDGGGEYTLNVTEHGAKVNCRFGVENKMYLYYEDPAEGSIIVTKKTTGGGIEVLHDGSELAEGDELTVEAKPNVGSLYALRSLTVNGEFRWSGTSVKVEEDVYVRAEFGKARKLTVKTTPSGLEQNVKVLDKNSGAELTDKVAEGQVIKVDAGKPTGYDKAEPKVKIGGAEAKEYAVGGDDVAVSVDYTLNTYSLTVHVEPKTTVGGGVSYSVVNSQGVTEKTLKDEEKVDLAYGTVVTIKPIEVAGFLCNCSLEGKHTVGGDLEEPVTYVMEAPKAVKYLPPIIEPAAVANRNQGGVKIYDEAGDEVKPENLKRDMRVTFKVEGVTGYSGGMVTPVSGLSKNPSEEVYTITGDVQVKVTYTPNQYNLTVEPQGYIPLGGECSVVDKAGNPIAAGDEKVKYDQHIWVNVEQRAAYEVEYAVEGATLVSGNEYVVTDNVTIKFTYRPNQFRVNSISVEPQGVGGSRVLLGGKEIVEGQVVYYGQEVEVVVDGADGYKVSNPKYEGLHEVSRQSGHYTYTVTGDVSVAITYTLKKYELKDVTGEGLTSGEDYSKKVTVTRVRNGKDASVSDGKVSKGEELFHFDELKIEVADVKGYIARVEVSGAKEKDGVYLVEGNVTVKVI